MRRTQMLAMAFLTVSSAVGLAPKAWSLVVEKRIEQPIPDEFRESAATLLKRVRPADAEKSLLSLKAFIWPKDGSDDAHFIMRIEADCHGVYCMTLIGSLSHKDAKLEFTLQAGPVVYFNSSGLDKLWGAATGPSQMFETRDGSGLIMVPREQGWVLTACSNCSGRAMIPPPAPPPQPTPKFDTFEAFRRALKDAGLDP